MVNGWKKVGKLNRWKKDIFTVNVRRTKRGYETTVDNGPALIEFKEFKKKTQALKFARSYMNSH